MEDKDFMTTLIQDMDADELLVEFRTAVEDLPGSGARGRSHYYKVYEELKNRLIDNTKE